MKDDGVILISIDDKELFNLEKSCNEVFGENNYIACFPRVTKKAGKSTEAIARNNDYILIYSKSNAPRINLPKHTDSGFKLKDEYYNERGFYKLNQTLDYDSLQYSESLDYPITIDGETIYPGGSYEKYLERKSGKHARADWAWRWSKSLFDFGLANGFIVVKKYENYSRIYTKTYQNVTIEKINNEFKIIHKERTRSISTLEFIENEFSNDNSKKNLLSIFSSSVFDYSKPLELLGKLAIYFSDNNDIILDFFSGSSTTAHAVMKQNVEDRKNRKFIMVQLPEMCDEKSEAYKSGYKNICDIGKERIRRAGDKIKEENKDKEGVENLDIGFKVFKLDSSNINRWDSSYDQDLEHNLLSSIDNIKEGRSEEDILYEVLLKYGIDLNVPIKEHDINGKKVFDIGFGAIITCLDDNLTLDIVEGIGRLKEELDPDTCRVVFMDNGFSSDSVKTNAVQILKKFNIEDVKSI